MSSPNQATRSTIGQRLRDRAIELLPATHAWFSAVRGSARCGYRLQRCGDDRHAYREYFFVCDQINQSASDTKYRLATVR